jgi:SnoaL-like protein
MTTVHDRRAYLQVWNQRDLAARRAAVCAVFSDACSYTDPLAAVTGHDGVDRFIAGVQQQFAGVRVARRRRRLRISQVAAGVAGRRGELARDVARLGVACRLLYLRAGGMQCELSSFRP